MQLPAREVGDSTTSVNPKQNRVSVNDLVSGYASGNNYESTTTSTMSSTMLKPPQKRVLGDATINRHNVMPKSPSTAKKRKLEAEQPTIGIKPSSQTGNRKLISSGPRQSQQKSQFEEEVLEKLTQDISGLKENNSEKDQQWARPSLDNFDASRDNLCFQQIEAEEGTIGGGKQPAVKLFGVTEVKFILRLYEFSFHSNGILLLSN